MEDILLCLLLIKLHLLALTQHRFFFLIKIVPVYIYIYMLHVPACTKAIYRSVNTKKLKRKIQ